MKQRPLQHRLLVCSTILMFFLLQTVHDISAKDVGGSPSSPTSSEVRKSRRNQRISSESSESFILSEPTSRQEVLVEEGDSVYIDCPMNSTRVLGCEWYKANSQIGSIKRITQFFDRYQRITRCKLHIRSVTYEDAGSLVCTAVTDTPLTFNYTNQLTVTGPEDPFGNALPKTSSASNSRAQPFAEPQIVKELLPADRIHTAHKGENVLLKCEANGNPKPMVSWWRGSKIYTNLTEGFAYLKLTNLTEDDAGAYKCEATNIFGRAVSDVYLKIKGLMQGASEILDVTPRNITLYEGNEGNITCIARFEGDPWFVWVKKIENKTLGINTFTYEGHDYSVLPRNEIRSLGQHLFSTTLLLKNVTTASAGVYHCIVAGLQGYNHSEAYVTVGTDPAKLHLAQIRRHKAVAVLWIFSFVIFSALVILCIVRIYGCPNMARNKPILQSSLPKDSMRKTELPKRSPETLSTDCTHPKNEVLDPLMTHGNYSMTSQDLSPMFKMEYGSSCRTYNSYDAELDDSDPENSIIIADLEAARSGYGESLPHHFHPNQPQHVYMYRHHPPRNQSRQSCNSSQSSHFPSVSQCSCNVDHNNQQNSQVNLVYVV